MTMNVYVNLPVKNLEKSKEFFFKLGFEFNQKFTDEKCCCMIVGGDNYVMLLTGSFFKTFTKKEICDATKATEVIVALEVESREKVDELFNKAVEAGATKNTEPMKESFMYQQNFQDLDGHVWEVFYMDESAMNQN
jgi:predicted lactoylglutathione lyase